MKTRHLAWCTSILVLLPSGCGDDTPPNEDRAVFDVVYRERSKVISEAQGKALLVGPSPTESTLKYTFEPSATAIAQLQPGDLAVLAGMAYRKVVRVQTTTAGLELFTERTTLPEVIQSGTIEWSQSVDFGAALQASALEAGALRSRASGLSYEGEIRGYKVSLNLTPSAGRVEVDAVVSLEIAGERRFAVQGTGHIEGFRTSGRAVIGDGGLIEFEAGQTQLRGELRLTAAAFNTGLSDELLSIPLGIDVPIQVGPVPLMLKVKGNVNVRLILSLMNSSAEASVSFRFDSDQGLRLAGTSVEATPGTASADLSELEGGSADTVAAGMSACLEFPRFELSMLGEFASVGITQNNCAQSVFTFDPPCNQVRGSVTILGLASLGFFGVTLASAQTEIYKTDRDRSAGMCE